MGGAFDIGAISKAKEDWVLATVARIDGKLHGFMFSTLERIGGTPCVLIGMLSVRRHSRRDQVLRGLMHEAYHRALMAFPDEDVVIGSRFVAADALDAFKKLDEVTPSPGSRAVGEERAWGRRLAKRFGVDSTYDDEAFIVTANGQGGFLDFESAKPEKIDADRQAMFAPVDAKAATLVVYGWTMAEDLVKLGSGRRRDGRVRRRRPPPADDAVVRSTTDRTPRCSSSSSTSPSRAPSAGKTQGWHVVVLRGRADGTVLGHHAAADAAGRVQVARAARRARDPAAVRRSKAYVDRYSEPDKAGTGLGVGPQAWPAPYWTIDTSMSIMILLLAAEDAASGRCSSGCSRASASCAKPRACRPVLDLLGAIALGYPA